MPNVLAIRSYNRQVSIHRHDYYQLVLPIQGRIEIALPHFQGWVGAGECIVIAAQAEHQFNAHEQAKFIVADLSAVPETLLYATGPFAISAPLSRFLTFVETQLTHEVNTHIEQQLVTLFESLLAQQDLSPMLDSRVRTVLEYIAHDLAYPHTLDTLAQRIHLSVSALKALFKRQVGLTVRQYLINKRIEAAQALLRHTDTPIQQVAEQVGYQDFSAFSRRFAQTTGLTPSKYRSLK